MFATAVALCGCSRSAPWAPVAGRPSSPPADANDSGYQAPPRARQAVLAGDGGTVLSGLALAGAAVRVMSPDGRGQQAQADDAGAWSVNLPSTGPAIYGLSQEARGRLDQAQGYVVVLPGAPPVAAELRSGAGARLLQGGPGKLQINAVDFDDTDAAVVSGWAAPNQPLRVVLDGAVADESTASATGRFSLALPKPLMAGRRSLQIVAPNGAEARADLEVGPAAPFAGVMRALKHGSSWRIDWKTPAGGDQTTILFPPRTGP
jgi:hypothetical protein